MLVNKNGECRDGIKSIGEKIEIVCDAYLRVYKPLIDTICTNMLSDLHHTPILSPMLLYHPYSDHFRIFYLLIFFLCMHSCM